MQEYIIELILISMPLWFFREQFKKLFLYIVGLLKRKKVVYDIEHEEEELQDPWDEGDGYSKTIPYEKAMYILRNSSKRSVISEDGKVYMGDVENIKNNMSSDKTVEEEINFSTKIDKDNSHEEISSIVLPENTINKTKPEHLKEYDIKESQYVVTKLSNGDTKIKNGDTEFVVGDNKIKEIKVPEKNQNNKINKNNYQQNESQKKEVAMHKVMDALEDIQRRMFMQDTDEDLKINKQQESAKVDNEVDGLVPSKINGAIEETISKPISKLDEEDNIRDINSKELKDLFSNIDINKTKTDLAKNITSVNDNTFDKPKKVEDDSLELQLAKNIDAKNKTENSDALDLVNKAEDNKKPLESSSEKKSSDSLSLSDILENKKSKNFIEELESNNKRKPRSKKTNATKNTMPKTNAPEELIEELSEQLSNDIPLGDIEIFSSIKDSYLFLDKIKENQEKLNKVVSLLNKGENFFYITQKLTVDIFIELGLIKEADKNDYLQSNSFSMGMLLKNINTLTKEHYGLFFRVSRVEDRFMFGRTIVFDEKDESSEKHKRAIIIEIKKCDEALQDKIYDLF